MSIKNSNYTIGNRTRNLPTCNAVSQPTVPPPTPIPVSCRAKYTIDHAPLLYLIFKIFFWQLSYFTQNNFKLWCPVTTTYKYSRSACTLSLPVSTVKRNGSVLKICCKVQIWNFTKIILGEVALFHSHRQTDTTWLVVVFFFLPSALNAGDVIFKPFCLHSGRNPLTLRLLMSYIYGAPILDVSRSHTTTHHSR